jgi:hypothetical protein
MSGAVLVAGTGGSPDVLLTPACVPGDEVLDDDVSERSSVGDSVLGVDAAPEGIVAAAPATPGAPAAPFVVSSGEAPSGEPVGALSEAGETDAAGGIGGGAGAGSAGE